MWNPKAECLSREELEELKLERLKSTVRHAYENVPFYRRKFQEAGIKPEDIRSLEDIRHLPFTTKEDLRENYPFGLFAVPLKEIVRIHASSGTTGKPTVVGYTREDIEVWSEVMARTLGMANASSEDVVQIAYGYGLFTGGLGVHYGAEKIGCTVIPTSGGNTKRQIMLMRDFGTTILCCTPSYACYLAEVMAELGVSPRELKLRAGLFGAEPWSEGMRREIESNLGIEALDIYGLSEIIGPGVAAECLCKEGLHIWEDHFLPEVIDPATGEPLPPGEEGELVFTTLTKRGFPVIRYRTRDISFLLPEPCACGRTHIRMGRVKGRTDDMLIIRGVNVFPSQIEEVLLSLGYTEPHYLLVVDRERRLDVLEVWVEVSEDIFRDEVRGLEELEEKIRREIEAVLGIAVKVRLVEPKTIQRSEGKAKRIVDRRDLK
ncbi:Phenylacetate--CoA ligase [Ammonifex degensii KC4]|uniref:Phenylacetate-coenzyme A ligase n=1 Tax=Ammonifex degensii (strain DSM 10501 / KC4) TaxID=429009 RepID=C9RAR1_AMMDK|nr:phenylacetate--CoA ligase [Ammonifex degensii]ACX51338.1 Phenylacetate--CoA ligase [Ammonifex degensii KC4]